MGKVLLDMTMSLDGFIAGPNGEGAGLHDWFFSAEGSGAVEESVGDTGAILMGRRTDDWGERLGGFAASPYAVDHFVLTREAPERPARGEMTFAFVTDGIEGAVERARAAAGDRNAVVGGGANVARQCLEAGLVDGIQIYLVPALLGEGIRLFEHSGAGKVELEKTGAGDILGATRLVYRIVKEPPNARRENP